MSASTRKVVSDMCYASAIVVACIVSTLAITTNIEPAPKRDLICSGATVIKGGKHFYVDQNVISSRGAGFYRIKEGEQCEFVFSEVAV